MSIKNIGGSLDSYISYIPDPIYGSGKDGNIIISSNTTLSRDMFYNNLTINNGIHLNTNGYRVFVRNIITFLGTSSGDSTTSIGLKNGSSNIGSLYSGGLTSVTNSLGGNSALYSTTLPASIIGSASYFYMPENAINAYVLNASQQTILMLKGGAGNGTNYGGGITVLSARKVSGNGTIYATGYNNGSSYVTGGGVIVFCSNKIKPSTIILDVSGYTSGTSLEFIV